MATVKDNYPYSFGDITKTIPPPNMKKELREKIIEILERDKPVGEWENNIADQILELFEEILPKELETKNIGNHYDLAQRNGYNLCLYELTQRINK